MAVPLGLTPKVARIHYDDVARDYELHISWQLVTPQGVFPEVEQIITLADLASVLDKIKSLWALVAQGTSDGTEAINAPIGDYTSLGILPSGMQNRTVTLATYETPDFGDVSAPDDMPDYDGSGTDWGATTP